MSDTTPTKSKFIYPYIRHSLDYNLSKQAKRKLKWMIYIQEGNSVAKASRHFDIPVRTLWYWVKRYNPHKPQTLEYRCRKPKRFRYSEVPLNERIRVVQIRKTYPNWGRKKIQKLLAKEGIQIGLSRIQIIVNQAGLKRIKRKRRSNRRNRKHMYTVPKQYLEKVGGLVYFDVKHLFLKSLGKKVYQFTAIDHATRYLFSKVYARATSLNGKNFFEYVKESLGVNAISYVGSDNGSEFLGLFDLVLSEQKVTHVFSSPRSPKQNPFVERVIRTVIEDWYDYKGLERNISKQQESLDRYIFTYNKIRPHESLDLDTPFERYVKLTKSLTM